MHSIADELRATNGKRPERDDPGRTITLSSGHTVGLRRQPGDVMMRARAAAEKELDSERPAIPTQRLETEPDVWRDIPNANDPEYVAELDAWNNRVANLTGQKLLLIMERIGLDFEIDHARLTELRETYAAIGVELPENDRSAYLGYVLAPTNDDQGRLFIEVFGRGLPQEAQVALHRRMFPGDVEGNPA